MRAVLKREFRAYFQSPLGYVFIAVLYFFTGYYFFSYNLYSNTTDMSNLFNQLFSVVLFLVPILTMRLMSEDKRSKTDQLLLTAPVRIWEIVLGKFFAALGAIVCCLLITVPWLIILICAGTPAWPTIIGCYIAILCASMVFLAIGLFLSSVTESQLIAAVLSFAVFLGLYLVDALSAAASGTLASILSWFSIFTRYDTFMSAQFSFSNVVYFLSLTVLFLFFTARVLERRRQ